MVELAIGFLGAYLARKASGVLDRAGADMDHAIDEKLGEMYSFVKGRLLRLGRRGERSLERLKERPDDAQSRRDVLEDLEEVLQQDLEGAAQLQMLVEDLKRLDPKGAYIRGEAKANTVEAGGQNLGVDVEGRLQPGDSVEGTATAATVKGEQTGVRYQPG